MKTQKIQNLLVVTLFCAAALAGLTACDADPVEREGGKLPDKDGLENTYGMLRSTRSVRDEVRVFLTEGNGFVTDNFYYQLTKPLGSALSLEAAVKAGEGETERTLLPEANYDFPDGKKLDIAGDAQHSALKRIRFFAENLAPGEYYLPLTVAADAADAADAERQTVNYLLTVRGLQMGEYKLNQEQVFTVFYLNTALYQPLLVDEYLMSKLDENWENAWPERPDGTRTIGDIVNLRTVVLDYDAATSRALLNLGADMRYVLGHATKYIRPLQDKGRKVCISIEGGGKGLGFCNLTDAQIADFTAQVKAVVTEYGLDGVNFWDRNSGYGKEGMPAMNTTSYPKLIKAVREALGDGLLVTLTDHMEPTEYFWDTAAMGGIEVGKYLDYAWSGYLDNSKDMQIVDPWHQGAAFVSAEWPASRSQDSLPPNTDASIFRGIRERRKQPRLSESHLSFSGAMPAINRAIFWFSKRCARFFRTNTKVHGPAVSRMVINSLLTTESTLSTKALGVRITSRKMSICSMLLSWES